MGRSASPSRAASQFAYSPSRSSSAIANHLASVSGSQSKGDSLAADVPGADAAKGPAGTRLQDAILTSQRARDENEKMSTEVMTNLERAFQPHDDRRLVARSFVVQLSRTAARLASAASALEREANDTRRLNEGERLELLARIRQLTSDGEERAAGLRGEVERAEAERGREALHLHNEFNRLKSERDVDGSRLSAEVSRLSAALDASRADTAALWSQAQQQQTMLAAEAQKLRETVTRLGGELSAARDKHGTDASTLSAQLAELGAEKDAAVGRLRGDVAYMTGLAAETQSKLEAQLVMVKVDKEAALSQLRAQLDAERKDREAAVSQLLAELEGARAAKAASETELRAALRKSRLDHEEEATLLRGRVQRLSSLQKAALDAGTLKARQVLYWGSVSGEREAPSISWRKDGEAQQWERVGDSDHARDSRDAGAALPESPG